MEKEIIKLPRLSIIIPVYNAEKYIDKCMNKVLSIPIEKEIVVVNDASTDGSAKILQKYADKIIICNLKKNMGVSHARNKGINLSTCDYLTFVDADDDFELDMHRAMLSKMLKDCSDVCICDNDTYLENGKLIKRKYKMNFDECSQSELIKMFLTDKICPAVWSSIYKTSISRKIMFDDRLKIGEDILFPLRYYLNSKKTSIVNKVLYHYVLHNGSSMHKLNNYLLQYLDVPNLLTEIEKTKIKKYYLREYEYFKLSMKIRSFHSISLNAKVNKKQAFELLKQLNITASQIKNIVSSEYTPRYVKIEFLILRIFGIRFHLFLFPMYNLLRTLVRKK